MPIQKDKNTKYSLLKKKETFDSKHQSFIDKFLNEENVVIPELYIMRELLYNEFNSEFIKIDEKIEIKDIIKNIDKKIIDLKKNKKKYFLDNSKYIFDYFENKKKISEGINNTKSIDNFFFKNNNSFKLEAETTTNSIQKYFTNIDSSYYKMSDYEEDVDICQSCKEGEMITIESEGLNVCNKCFVCSKFLTDNEKPSYKEPPKEVCFYAYKRINHFREILAQFQAKETTLIPEQVIEDIKNQIKKERLEINTTSNKGLKEVLKKLKYNKYYEHIPFIKDKLGVKPPVMSPELEETLCNLFIDIQIPYAKYCPQDRVNFLNYYYTIYKLCELLGQKQFLSYFPMLKDREKRMEQDEIWKKICHELEWSFIPTI